MERVPQSISDRLFRWAVGNRIALIRGFQLFYVILIALLVFGGREIFFNTVIGEFFVINARWFGRAALIFYIATTIPGIASRFGIQHKLISILMIFRRYIGIAMYLLASVHFSFLRGIDWITRGISPSRLFEFMGLTALCLLFSLFLTSNDLSVKMLGLWWARIHKLTYIAMFFIFFHVMLQRVDIWSVLIGADVVLQVTSFFVSWRRTKT